MEITVYRSGLSNNNEPGVIPAFYERQINPSKDFNIFAIIKIKNVRRLLGLFLMGIFFTCLQVKGQAISSYARVTSTSQQYTKVEFDIAVSGSFTNPYNAPEISLDMVITSPSGLAIIQPCFYNSGTSPSSNWVARFTPKEVGNYSYFFRLTESGTVVANSTTSTFTTTATSKDGFLHTVNVSDWILQFDDGKPFKGIGMDYGWQPRNYESQQYIYSYLIPRLAENGANFFRTWMCPWNLPLEWKNVINTDFYTSSSQYFNPSAIAGMDSMVDLAEANGMYMMLTLNTFGDLIGQWSTNNYNVTEGGPCTNPDDFFAMPAAKAMFENRLRYIIARWGYSTSIAAFELFNEIDNAVYGTTPNLTQSDVTEWHAEMSAYLKSLDPYGHMVTTSISYQNITGLTAVPSFNFNQQHIYGNGTSSDIIKSIPTTIRSYDASTGKPYVIGEYGYDYQGPDTNLGAQNDSNFHQGLWYGIFSPTPIAPMSWWWEMFDARNTTVYFHNIQDISNKMIAAGGGSMLDLTVNGSSSLEKYGAQCGNSYFIYSRNESSGTLTTNLSLALSGTSYDVQIYNTTTGVYSDQGILASSGGILTLPAVILGSGADVIMIITNTLATAESPYGGSPWPIPGIIQAENYDIGGQGIAYNDSDASNDGGQYRLTEGVDIEACTDTGGGYDVGWTVSGEWMNYFVNVTTSGTYQLQARVASPNTAESFHVEIDGTNISGPINVPNTGGWQSWKTVTVTTPILNAGAHVMRIVMDSGGFNLNDINFSLATAGTCPDANTSFIATQTTAGNTYQWQVAINSGSYSNINNNTIYSGAATDTLVLSNTSTSLYGYTYRCAITNNAVTTYSPAYTLQFAETWIGAVNTAWETAGNWSCGVLPDSNTDVIINSGTVNISSAVKIKSMHLNTSSVNLTVNTVGSLDILH
jgi:hypothetical protein